MTLQGYYTDKGRALAAKAAGGITPLIVTRVVAGSGHTEDIPSATALPDSEQTLTVGTAEVDDVTAVLPVTLVEVSAVSSYSLTELGVYASDPDEGEILFQVYQLDSAADITAGGESVLRFYLRQSIGAPGVEVICSPSGTLVDRDIAPTRSKVLAKAVNTVSADVAAAELQAYLNALPRLLTADYVITVSGTHTDIIRVSGFYGSGSITIQAEEVGSCVFSKTILVEYCRASIFFKKIKWQFSAATTSGTYALGITHSNVEAENCCFLGYKDGSTRYGCGIDAQYAGNVLCRDCTFKLLDICVHTTRGAYIEVMSTLTPEELFEDNNAGVYLWFGGIVLLTGTTPDVLGGTWNAKSHGGMRVSASNGLPF